MWYAIELRRPNGGKTGANLYTVVFASALQKNEFSRFPAVETYEADDGILIMPKHSDAGNVCSVVLERRHVSSQGVDLDAKMSREEIRRIFDELAPRSERGQSKLNLGEWRHYNI